MTGYSRMEKKNHEEKKSFLKSHQIPKEADINPA